MKKRKSDSSTSSAESEASDSDLKEPVDIVELPHKFRFRRRDYKKSGKQGKDIMKSNAICDVIDNHPKYVIDASGAATTTKQPTSRTTATSQKPSKRTIQAALDGSQPNGFQTTSFSARDFLAKLSRSQANGKVSATLVERFSTRYSELRKLKDLSYYCLRTSKDSSATMKDLRSKSSSNRWRTWGIGWNGRYLTANISGFHRTEKECSLSDILEEKVDEKYFLSDRLVKTLMKHKKRHEEAGHGFGMNIIECQEASESEEAEEKKTLSLEPSTDTTQRTEERTC